MGFSNPKSPNLDAQPSLFARIPKPFAGHPWADFIYLLLLAALQLSIIPSLLPEYLAVDLLTPWVALSFAHDSPGKAIIHGFLAAMLIETHSSSPAGLYICAYWILGAAITLMRDKISWHRVISWLSLLIFAQTWIFIAEFTVSLIESYNLSIDFRYYLGQVFRITITILFGWLMIPRLIHSTRWRATFND